MTELDVDEPEIPQETILKEHLQGLELSHITNQQKMRINIMFRRKL